MAIFQETGANNSNQGSERKIRVKSVLRYTMMPEILPRIRGLGIHFGHFAYLLALVFSSARLIPQGHPALNAANIGRYGVRQVIAMAANNIKWDRNHIDQIGIFTAIVIGLIMIVIQAGLIGFAAMAGFGNEASAQSFFSPSNEYTGGEYVATDDVALRFLAQTFGNDLGLFDEVGAVVQTVPVHDAIRAALGFYSMATMVIALIIVVYYIMTVVGEAAKTGTPFGQRFNSLWAPIRLVVALGLLVPLGSGLNSAQYITLWMAEMGSGMATNAWSIFASEMTSAGKIVAQPDVQTTTSMVQGIWAAEVCRAGYNQINKTSRPAATQGSAARVGAVRTVPSSEMNIVQNVNGVARQVSWNVQQMTDLAVDNGMSSINLIWTSLPVGSQLTKVAGRSQSTYQVGKRCGSFNFDLSNFDVYKDGNSVSTSSGKKYFWSDLWGPGSEDKLGQVTETLRSSYMAQFKNVIDELRPEAENYAAYKLEVNKDASRFNNDAAIANIEPTIDRVARETFVRINASLASSFNNVVSNINLSENEAFQEMVSKGWGAAGIWFANIGKINQFYQENSNTAFPTSGITAIGNGNTSYAERLFGGSPEGVSKVDKRLVTLINQGFEEYGRNPYSGADPATTDPGLYEEITFSTNSYSESTGYFTYAIMYVFGASELYSLRVNPTLDPMVRLMGAGSGMVDGSLVLFGLGAGSAIGGAIAENAKDPRVALLGDAASAASGLFFTLAAIGLVAGIVLFYILPLMPFVYFVFAVIHWLLEIFEAVIAMPLWALSHLRIEGDGMPGQAAIQGYALILMIFLRPILIVFGLVAGYVLFGAAIFFLSSTFDLAVGATRQDIDHSNIASTDTLVSVSSFLSPFMTGPVGALGLLVYTLIFTFLAYNIAIMCFKMVDDVPKQILRWLGVGAQTFADSQPDPIQGQQSVLAGAVVAGGQLKGGLTGARQSFSQKRDARQAEEDSAKRHKDMVDAMKAGNNNNNS